MRDRDRIGLTRDAIEVEAESVSYMVATRLGLETSSDAYLASYAKDGKVPEGVSLDLIAKVAGKITEMGEHFLPKLKHKARNQMQSDTRVLTPARVRRSQGYR